MSDPIFEISVEVNEILTARGLERMRKGCEVIIKEGGIITLRSDDPKQFFAAGMAIVTEYAREKFIIL